MLQFVGRRLLALVPVLLGVTFVAFLAMYLTPGDPALLILGERATTERVEALRRELGLDRPFLVQYGVFLANLVRGDLGRSTQTNNPVVEDILQRFPATVELTVAAMLIACLVGLTAGVVSAVRQYSVVDYAAMVGSLVGVSMPIFWLGFVLMIVFSLRLDWLPLTGRFDVSFYFPRVTNFVLVDTLLDKQWDAFMSGVKHLVLPAVTLSTVPMAIIARMTRSSMLEVLRQDYVRTARAKGLAQFRVVVYHALRNAFIPILTVIGLQFGLLLGGAILTETVFAWPGIGRLTVEAIYTRDYPLIRGCVLLVAATFVLINLVVDVLYATIDPRIRVTA
jgi:peptide/nickel transport system permease protein